MGTKSSVTVLDENGRKIINLYRQFDGYPEGMGKDIFDRFGNVKLINGYGTEHEQENCWANGIVDLAAMIVCELKTQCKKILIDHKFKTDTKLLGIGDVYLYPLEAENKQSFNYVIYSVESTDDKDVDFLGYKNRIIHMSCSSYSLDEEEILYDGPLSEFGKWLEKDEEKEE